jgi:hypothetical protein
MMKKLTILAVIMAFALALDFALPAYADNANLLKQMEIVGPVDVSILDQPVQMEMVNGEREPFQVRVEGNCSSTAYNVNVSFTVDSTKRLIVDNFTATFNVPAGAGGILSVGTTVNGVHAYHNFALPYAASYASYDVLIFGKTLRLVADPGSTVSAIFNRTAVGDACAAAFSLTGFLEPVP